MIIFKIFTTNLGGSFIIVIFLMKLKLGEVNYGPEVTQLYFFHSQGNGATGILHLSHVHTSSK